MKFFVFCLILFIHFENAIFIKNLQLQTSANNSITPSNQNCIENITLETLIKNAKQYLNTLLYKQKQIFELQSIQSNKNSNNPNNSTISQNITNNQSVVYVLSPSHHCNDNWNYDNNGSDWECECNNFERDSSNSNQSPIDLPDVKDTRPNYCNVLYDFNIKPNEEVLPFWAIEDFKLKIKGYFGQLKAVNNKIYRALEIELHTPSEHTIKGERFDLEMQIIFFSTQENKDSKIILSILFKKTPNAKNLFFDNDVDLLKLPDLDNKSKNIDGKIDIRNLFKTNKEDLFEGFNYYEYEGSRTSPPCIENVKWHVVADVLPISITTLETLKDALKPTSELLNIVSDCKKNTAKAIINNNRLIQPRNNRRIYFVEEKSKIAKIEKPEKILGHFEKVKREHYEYYFVDGKSASNVSNAELADPNETKNLFANNYIKNFLSLERQTNK